MKTRLRSLPLLLLGLFFAAAILAPPAYAQTSPGNLDSTFSSSANNTVIATALQPDGKIIIGGNFTSVGERKRERIARLNPDGSLDTSFNASANSTVWCTAVQPDGKILIGGDFTQLGTVFRSRMARLNPDGSVDTSFHASMEDSIRCISVQPDGRILVGGMFLSVNKVSCPYFARLNADGSLDTSFKPFPNFYVYSTAVQADGRILIAGAFWSVAGVPRPWVARLETDGTLDTSFAPSINGKGDVNCMAVDSRGRILIAGDFSIVGGETHNGIARLNQNGSVDSSFTGSITGSVNTMALQVHGRILVGGNFSRAGDIARNCVARLTDTGAVDLVFNPNAIGTVYSTIAQPDGKVLISGNFLSVGGQARSRIARVHAEGVRQTLSAPKQTHVSWQRSGGAPEVTAVTFESSTDGGATWTFAGNGRRKEGGWEAFAVNLPTHGTLRARAYTAGGAYGGSSGLIENLNNFAFNSVPRVTNSIVREVFNQSANLFVYVNPSGFDTEVWFEYGTTTAYGQSSASQILEGATAESMHVHQGIAGLEGNTTYHFRAVARNSQGTVYGLNQTFTTSNSAPVAVDDTFHLSLVDRPGGRIPLDVLTNDNDPDSEKVTLLSFEQGSKGTVTLAKSGTVLEYTPGEGFDGNDSFLYTIRDDHGGTAMATVTLFNALPVAGNDQYHPTAGLEPETFAVLENDTDADSGDVLTITAVTHGVKGTVTTDGTSVTYTPGEGYDGADYFSYTISDGHGGVATASVNLVNAAPVAVPDTMTVVRGSRSLNVLANDSDADGDTLTVSAVTDGAFGNVSTDGATVTYTPGPAFRNGDSFTYTINDGRGKSATATVTIVLERPVTDYVVDRNVQVYGEPSGTVFARFGVPSINSSGLSVFVAKMKPVTGPMIEGVFAAGSGTLLIAKAGNDAPGINGAKFSDFRHPALNEEGHVAFIASVSGVPRNKDAGIWSMKAGNLALVAQTGTVAAGTGGATFSRFDSLVLPDTGRVAFVATLTKGVAGVTDRNDLGVWAEDENGTVRLLVQERDKVLLGEELRVVKSISAFAALSGSAGQRRGFNAEGDLLLRLGFVDGGKALVRVTEEGTFQEVALEGATTEELAGAKFSGFGLGTLSDDGTALFRATLEHTKGSVAGHNDVAILSGKDSSDLRLVARTGNAVPNLPGAVFKSLKDPVGNAEGGIAFIGCMVPGKGAVTRENDVAIWVSDEEGEPSVLVREGDAAPGVEGRTFAEFNSLAFPGDRGVAFVASVSPESNSGKGADEKGLWAQDSHGNLRLLIREGQKFPVNGVEKMLKKFTVLSAVTTSPSQGHSYSGNGGFAYRATFADGSEGVFTVWVP